MSVMMMSIMMMSIIMMMMMTRRGGPILRQLCKSIPADDSLLRTAGSPSAILSKQLNQKSKNQKKKRNKNMINNQIQNDCREHQPHSQPKSICFHLSSMPPSPLPSVRKRKDNAISHQSSVSTAPSTAPSNGLETPMCGCTVGLLGHFDFDLLTNKHL